MGTGRTVMTAHGVSLDLQGLHHLIALSRVRRAILSMLLQGEASCGMLKLLVHCTSIDNKAGSVLGLCPQPRPRFHDGNATSGASGNQSL